jgi:hypothetical protein
MEVRNSYHIKKNLQSDSLEVYAQENASIRRFEVSFLFYLRFFLALSFAC